jgi:hypothetical protein
MKKNYTFEADDGTIFKTAAECKAYEAIAWRQTLVGLSELSLNAGLSRESFEIADALERAGNIIAKKRRENRELKLTTRKPDNPSDQNATMDKIKKQMKAIS